MPDTAPTYSVFIDDDEGYAVEAGSEAYRSHIHTGRTLVAEGVPDRLSAWRMILAAGVPFNDYDDRFQPIWMSTPTKLYRSMSLFEFADILKDGFVTGGANRDIDFEFRPFVFFSPAMTEACIFQGSEIDRMASHLAYAAYSASLEEGDAFDAETFRDLFRNTRRDLKDFLVDLPYNTAVIETHPVRNGLHYSTEHGRTAMNGEDEYGFIPGHIKLSDVCQVHWVKDMRIVRTTSVDEARQVIAEFDLPRFFAINQFDAGLPNTPKP